MAMADNDLGKRLERRISKSGISKSELGMYVVELKSNGQAPLYSLNAEMDFIPASLTKAITAAAVLEKMAPTKKFKTQILCDGEIRGSKLSGDLILKGGGDPAFVSESMWFLVNEFVRTGITEVTGGIIVDDSRFDRIRTDPSREPTRVDRAYDAPVGAMSFNWNAINIYVRPTRLGEKVEVILDPAPAGFRVVNNGITVSGRRDEIRVSRVGETVIVNGKLGIDKGELQEFKNISDPVHWSGENLREFLNQRGVKVKGKVKSGTTPIRATLLAEAESKPVSQHLIDMMKFSNNFVAEMLVKNLAVESGTSPGSIEAGMKLVNQAVVKMGVPQDRFTLINPSGLNRRNRIRPVDMVTVLLYSFRRFPSFAEFLASLPVSGTDGTLKTRMVFPPAKGWVRAKTGMLTGVNGLAGFAGRPDGREVAFVFIHNGSPRKTEKVRALLDQMAEELVK